MGQIGQLLMPDMYDAVQGGISDGQQQRARRTLAQYAQPALGGDQNALAQIYSADPNAGMRVQQSSRTMQQQALADKDAGMARLGKQARMVTAAAQSGDMDMAQSLYTQMAPEAQQTLGKPVPPQLSPDFIPHLQAIADAYDPPAKADFIKGQPGDVFLDPRNGKPAFSIPAAAPKDSSEIATLKALQADPGLMATYQKIHPRPAASVTGGFGRAPSGYRFTPNGDLEAIAGGPADSSGSGQGLTADAIDNAAWAFVGTGKLPAVGRGKEGVAQRTAVMNRSAAIAKAAGISPAELQTVPGRNRALQSSLTNLQKISDVMEKSETAFQNNTKVAMDLSSKLSRSGSPALNKWILGAKGQMGDPDVQALDAAITTMSVDYARIMSGATGAGGTPISTAEEAKALIRKELSHKSLQAVVDVLDRDIKGQQAAVHDQRGKIINGMQQMHDEASGGGQASGSTASPADNSDPLGLLK